LNNHYKNVLCRKGLSQLDKILIILSINPKKPKHVKDIIRLGIELGVSKINAWPISSRLTHASEKVIHTPDGWELTSFGLEYISNIVDIQIEGQPSPILSNLRKHLVNINNPDTRKFLEEAIHCFEYKLYRSAIVLSWVGAISILYDWIIVKKLKEFNTELIKKFPNSKPIKTHDDFGRLREKDFLEIISSISVIGKNVKQELEKCLILRNSCGHPNSLKIAENTVAAHLEILTLNVFEVFC
jgi:hypothetical protein